VYSARIVDSCPPCAVCDEVNVGRRAPRQRRARQGPGGAVRGAGRRARGGAEGLRTWRRHAARLRTSPRSTGRAATFWQSSTNISCPPGCRGLGVAASPTLLQSPRSAGCSPRERPRPPIPLQTRDRIGQGVGGRTSCRPRRRRSRRPVWALDHRAVHAGDVRAAAWPYPPQGSVAWRPSKPRVAGSSPARGVLASPPPREREDD
jgi:hypothetical protein